MSSRKQKQSAALKYFSLLAVVVGSTLLAGTLYGRLTQRWGPAPNLLAAAEHVNDFPERLGNWQAVEEQEFPQAVKEMLRCAAETSRKYVNLQTGQSVNIAIIVGPPGPTAVHTPEICYSSKAYVLEDKAEKVTIGPNDDTYWRVRFKSRDLASQQLQVYYAWGDGQHWKASDHPRVEYGGRPLLYKIQLAAVTDSMPGKSQSDPAFAFLQTLAESSWITAQSNQ